MQWLTCPPPNTPSRWLAVGIQDHKRLLAVGCNPNGWSAWSETPLSEEIIVFDAPTWDEIALSEHEAFETCEYARKVWIAAKLGNWVEMGKAINKAWEFERKRRLKIAPIPSKSDLMYAAARSAGSPGGRPGNGYLLVVAPENCRKEIIASVQAIK